MTAQQSPFLNEYLSTERHNPQIWKKITDVSSTDITFSTWQDKFWPSVDKSDQERLSDRLAFFEEKERKIIYEFIRVCMAFLGFIIIIRHLDKE